MQVMTKEEIRTILKFPGELTPDNRISQLLVCEDQQSTSIVRGADYAKMCIATDNETEAKARYVVKYPRYTGSPLLSVTSELICARIGRQLFAQPVCPPFAIADPLQGGSDERGFGSKFLAGYDRVHLVRTDDPEQEKSDLERIKSIPSPILAKIIVFHIWLVTSDAEILIHKNGKEAFSIDHGFFLQRGNENKQAGVYQIDVYAELLKAINAKDIEVALNELERFDQRKVVEAFAAIPDEWLVYTKNVEGLVERILQRKVEVRTEIARCASYEKT